MSPPIPKAKHSGILHIGTMQFRCHVLANDSQRIISVIDFFEALQVAPTERHTFIKYLIALQEHPISRVPLSKSVIARIQEPLLFQNNQNLDKGYDAQVFVDFCKLLLEIRRTQIPLTPAERNRCDIAERILVSLANIGIVALIDEATGFQKIRPRDALQILLDKYLRTELAAWAKTFPDEFYIEMFRLKGWEWKGMHINRPQVVGLYTRNIIYERLAPGVLEELEARNPLNTTGERAARHHQWLTADVGHPALAQHLHAVISLMRASSNWSMFRRLLDRAFPRRGDTLELDLDIETP